MTSLIQSSVSTGVLIVALCAAPIVPFSRIQSQIYHIEEMNTEQIHALDRARTVIIMPGGILEQHGPYLPSWSDAYFSQRLASDLAQEIVKRPSWKAVFFPMIPLGSGGANDIGEKWSFPGSYNVRPATLRAVYMDLATALGEQGFRWIFVVNSHGGPRHNLVLDQAGDYFRDTFGGHMVHVTGVLTSGASLDSLAGQALAAEDGFTVHAGLAEHSQVMALRPDLVPATIKNAPTIRAADFPDLVRIAHQPEWPGYVGAPRHASVALGQALLARELRAPIEAAMKILDGADERSMPRYSKVIFTQPGVSAVMDSSAKHDSVVEARQQAWLARQRP
jgi:creatinine amidohydrolase/Fe(II)-dependent formamide hydrolase-like protein